MKKFRSFFALALALLMMFALTACGEVDEELLMGNSENGVYGNAFLGIGCKLGGEWSFASREELLAQVNITLDAFDDETIQEQLKNCDMFYDLLAQKDDGLTNINIVVQKIGVPLGEDKYADMSMEQLPSQLQAAGFSIVNAEKTTVDFAGASHSAIRMSNEVQGVCLNQLCVFVSKGIYMANVTFTSYETDDFTELLNAFYALG